MLLKIINGWETKKKKEEANDIEFNFRFSYLAQKGK